MFDMKSMTIRQEFEILRGEPIAVNEIAPVDVPCIEMVDAKRLCRNPVVSVHMMAYNHAKYIARFRLFVDHEGYSISSKGFLPTVVDIMLI